MDMHDVWSTASLLLPRPFLLSYFFQHTSATAIGSPVRMVQLVITAKAAGIAECAMACWQHHHTPAEYTCTHALDLVICSNALVYAQRSSTWLFMHGRPFQPNCRLWLFDRFHLQEWLAGWCSLEYQGWHNARLCACVCACWDGNHNCR